MPYVKAHPFGYKPIKENRGKYATYKSSKSKKQTVTYFAPYEVTIRDEEGNPVMQHAVSKSGKVLKQLVPAKDTFYNKFTRVIQHVKHGRY
jgi:hypothetical protein